MRRDVQPELLDQLPEDHPDALANRRDMHRLNRWMGNFRWIARCIRERTVPPETPKVEIAAGDGSLALHLCRVFPMAERWNMTGVDLWTRPESWPSSWAWEQANLLEAEALKTASVLIANHILHQFSDAELGTLGLRLQQNTQLLIVNETCRKSIHLWQARCLGLLGMNHVSRHDAFTSVRAGFQGEELPTLLGLAPEAWAWSIQTTSLGAYRMLAMRRDGTFR